MTLHSSLAHMWDSSYIGDLCVYTFSVGEMQHRVAEFCYCFYLQGTTHSFNFPLVECPKGKFTQVLEKYGCV